MKLMSIIREMKTKPKELVGQGAFHKIYPSKSNPNIVYKVGDDEELINRWYNLFNEHPDLFPKVYGGIKSFEFPVKAFNGKLIANREGKCVMVERLNTDRFKKLWSQIDDFCVEQPLQHYVRHFDESMGFFQHIGKKIQKLKPEIYQPYNEFINLVDSLYEIKPSADLHVDQFGYDKSGKLKCLDI